LSDTKPMKSAAKDKHIFIAQQLCAKPWRWDSRRIDIVVGSDGLVCRPVPSPLKQCRLSFAWNKIQANTFNFVTAMKLKVGFKNPRRHLKIICLWKVTQNASLYNCNILLQSKLFEKKIT
jgi:hypothetical protein